MASQTPMHIDFNSLTLGEFDDAPLKMFSLAFSVRSNAAGTRATRHTEAIANITYGLALNFTRVADKINIEDAIEAIRVKYTRDIFVVAAPEPVQVFALDAQLAFRAVCGPENLTYALRAIPYTGPTTLTEKRTETVMTCAQPHAFTPSVHSHLPACIHTPRVFTPAPPPRRCVVTAPFCSIDKPRDIEDALVANTLNPMGLKLVRFSPGKGRLREPTGKYYTEFEMIAGDKHFPFDQLHMNKSFTTANNNAYMIKWNEHLCTKYDVCPQCYRSTVYGNAIRCTCVTDGQGSLGKRRRSSAYSTHQANLAAAGASMLG